MADGVRKKQFESIDDRRKTNLDLGLSGTEMCRDKTRILEMNTSAD